MQKRLTVITYGVMGLYILLYILLNAAINYRRQNHVDPHAERVNNMVL